MPTGYTADVADGKITDLKPFAMQLARGMGALVMMRDDPHDAPIPDRFEPSDYNAKRYEEAQAEYEKLLGMSETEADAAAFTEYLELVAARAAAEASWHVQRQRYLDMIAKVEAWEGAPEGIKEFGLEQLRGSLKFDCGDEFKYWRKVERLTGAEWRKAALARAASDVAYSAKSHQEEVARVAARNLWLAKLRQSLK